MPICPNCQTPLTESRDKNGIVYICSRCSGRATGIGLLKRINIEQEFINKLWRDANEINPAGTKKCPHCQKIMPALNRTLDGVSIIFDLCPRCHSLWLDNSEFEKLPKNLPAPIKPTRMLSPQVREKIALAKLRDKQAQYDDVNQDPPTTWGKIILGILGFPIESKDHELKFVPYLTLGLAVILTALFFITYNGSRELHYIIWRYHSLLSILIYPLTHHGNIVFFIFSLYFFILFGIKAENILGGIKYLGLVFGSFAAGILFHILLNSNKTYLFATGVSTTVFSLMAYFTAVFPEARFKYYMGYFGRGFLWFLWDYGYWANITSYMLLGGYLLFALLYSFLCQDITILAPILPGIAIGLTVGCLSRKAE